MNNSTTPAVFNFHGDNLMLINFDNQPFIAMRQLVESIGLDWKSQFTKLKTNARWGVVEIATPSNGGLQQTLCLPLRKLHGWLMTLHPRKVKPDLRDKVIAYQNECDDALWAYWNDGIAIRTPYVTNPNDSLSAAQADQLRLALKEQCDKLPKDKQGAFMTKGWSKLKSHFGCTYRDIPQREFTEAISLVSRHVAEWELLDEPKLETKSNTEQMLSLLAGGRWLLSVQRGNLVLNPVPQNAFVVSPEEFPMVIRETLGVPAKVLSDVIGVCASRLQYIHATPP